MIKVQDWVASIPEEEKHVAYMGEGKSETRQFLLCGDGWQTYRQWGFHLDMAFDPQSITAHQQRQVEETRVNTTKNTDETGVNTQEVTTKESYTTDDKTVVWDDLTDIAALSKTVTEEGILLTWQVLYQHTRLPGRLWANLRAVGPDTQQVKKSALMVFEVDPSVDATPSDIPTMNEFEQMEARVSQLCEQAYTSADTAVSAASGAVQSQQQAASAATAAAQSATEAASHHQHVEELKQAATNTYNNAVHYAQVASEQATAAETAQQQVATMKDVIVKVQNNAKHHAEVAAEKAIEAEEYYESTAALKQMAININENTKHHAQIATTKADEAAADAATVAESRQAIQKAVGLCSQYTQRCETVMYNLEADQRAAALHCINVKDYGAKGEGGDDQQSIYDALQAAVENIRNGRACEVYFPAGVYGLTSGGFGIRLPQGTGGLLIRGAGRETTVIQYLEEWQSGNQYGNGWYALDVAPEGTAESGNQNTYIHDVTITGLTIRDDFPDKHATHTAKGNATSVATGEENHGVNIGYCVRASVTDCNLINLGDEVIDIYSCEDTIVSNNHIENCPAAGPSGGAITIADGSRGAVVSENTIIHSGADYVLTADDFGGADGIMLPAGVQMSGSIELPDGTVIGRYTTLTEDTFIPVGTKLMKSNYGVAVESLYTPVADVVISGNTILDMHGKGISLGATNEGASIANVVITNNVIRGCDMGIRASGTYPKSGVKIHDNIIADCAEEAILTTAIEDMTICGNTIRNIKGKYAIDTTSFGAVSRQLITDNLFENIENMAIGCSGTVIVKDCLFNGVGTTATPLAAMYAAITKVSGVLTVSGCTLKDIRLNGVKSGINGADYIEYTDIELISKTGVANAGGDAINAGVKKLIGGNIGGRIAITQDNAVVRDVTIVSTNIGNAPIYVNANGVSVIGCNIHINGIYPAIKEADGKNYNLFANNIANKGITVVGAQTVAVNNINTSVA